MTSSGLPVATVRVCSSHPDLTPSRAHCGDAAFDLFATETVLVRFGRRELVNTGVRVAIPEGFAGLVVARSGLASKHGVTVLNAPGLIDSGYRGEIKVCLFNSGFSARDDFTVHAGDRIAQLLVVPCAAELVVVSELPESGDGRGEAGFGSTGMGALSERGVG